MAETKNWPMIRMYANLVKHGRRTLEEVPKKYRDDVEAYLNGTLTE
ncbi:MAG: hypothetical protein IJT82_03680 [Schwartzia sp.]|nr:hypothetical protein [Schwartzia sp. (in: firmicutes)]